MRNATRLLLGASLILGTCLPAVAQTASGAPPVAAPAPSPSPAPACDATAIDSPPGKAWWAENRWRYADDAAATAAYQALVKGQSPWPSWYVPTVPNPPITVLPTGTRFQMAIAPGQQPDSPGGWGTFDYIADVEDVRAHLAVTTGFKAAVDRVVTYEVVRLLPVTIGPVGPQVDAGTCSYLPGRWSQFNMLPPWNERMGYLKVIEVRPIN
ncbi:hypothetical protein ACFQ1E_06790 [Sphingomonas canadensis]|uniref:Uncharacterized protein n=1 Tax=Sphingomonas canadensis TaxID=1219257 RepID=A0ABW3H5A5_9SPHN|nr:hypothetical protein [Sphingomonas canadensis]MCW3835506.1 hypothetical protein [Sphingomonas canadensis]